MVKNTVMSTSIKKINLSGLARKLVLDGLLEDEKARNLLEEAQKKKKIFVSLLVENKLVSSIDIALAAGTRVWRTNSRP